MPIFPSGPDPDQSDVREMLMPPILWNELQKNSPRKTLHHNANVRAFLSRFVLGGEVDNLYYMKSWRDDVFELRVQMPKRKEALRIFGGFARPDTFIALTSKPRREFGGMNDPNWDKVIEKTMAMWDAFLPGCRRVSSRPFGNCVTANAYDCFNLGGYRC